MGKHKNFQKLLQRQGCLNTLAYHNEAFVLELPRAWEPLDSSLLSEALEGSSTHSLFFKGNKTQ